ncbi:MAG: hypothetical protein ABI898_06860 [Sphingomonadales bacterium]
MATLAESVPARRDDRFFLTMAYVMTAIVFFGFSFHLAMGRATFARPWYVHAHAIVFMGWVVINLLQNVFAAKGLSAWHRRLGWLATMWVVAMVALGCTVTLALVQHGDVPFFFTPLQFLVFDPMTLFAFAGLTAAAVTLRRQTDWHRRLHYCAMTLLVGPALGRLLPVPFLIPFAFEAVFAACMVFPVIGVVADIRRTGAAHPAWRWGIGTLLATFVVIEAITFSPVGNALYRAATAGTPGASIAPLEFPPSPLTPLRTGPPASI